MNGQIRKFFPKGQSVDKYTKNDIKQINKTFLNTTIHSLDGIHQLMPLKLFTVMIYIIEFWILLMANVSEFILAIDN